MMNHSLFLFFILLRSICSMGMPLFVHSSVHGYLGCFQFLAIANKMLQTFEYQTKTYGRGTKVCEGREPFLQQKPMLTY